MNQDRHFYQLILQVNVSINRMPASSEIRVSVEEQWTILHPVGAPITKPGFHESLLLNLLISTYNINKILKYYMSISDQQIIIIIILLYYYKELK